MSESRVSFDLRLDALAFVRAMDRAGRVVHKMTLALMRTNVCRRHLRRCAICSPYSNPRPLAINGHDYHRRSKSRRNR